jgi:hypothetical protein
MNILSCRSRVTSNNRMIMIAGIARMLKIFIVNYFKVVFQNLSQGG